MFSRVDKIRVKTFRPGFRILNLAGDAEYNELLNLQSKGKLRERFPDKTGINRHAKYFHEQEMLIDPVTNDIKKVCVVMQVPLLLDNGQPNMEGIIDLDTDEEAAMLLNALKSFGDNRIKIDTAFGRDLGDKSLVTPVMGIKEQDDLSRKKVPGR